MSLLFGPRKKLASLPVLDPIFIRQRTGILVIDDDPSAFPVELFQQAGYSITYWNKIENMQRLCDFTYDIIILDVMGVADKFDGDGLDVLKLIKKNAPSQLIIAFSGSKSVQSKEEFWKLSDGALKKPIRFFECQQYLDDFIDKHISINTKWIKLRDELIKGRLAQKDIDRIEECIVTGIGGDASGVANIRKILSGNGLIKIDSVLSIVNSFIQIYTAK